MVADNDDDATETWNRYYATNPELNPEIPKGDLAK